jgi:TonB family protein
MMLATWMLRVVLVSSLVGMAALAGELLLRALGRQARWSWAVALGGLFIWLPVSPLLARARLPAHIAERLPALPVTGAATTVHGGLALDLARAIALLWALASIILAVRLVSGLRAVQMFRSRTSRTTLDGVPVLLGESIGPATIGFRRPDVLVPSLVFQLEHRLRDLVLRHEREHCVARDPVLLLAGHVALVVYPWNIPLWWIARRLALAVELDCDARVIRAHDDRTRYAQVLLLFAQRGVMRDLAPALAMSRSHLTRRIRAMQAETIRPRRTTLAALGVSGVVAAAAACSAGLVEAPKSAPSAAPHASVAGVSDPRCPGCFEFTLDEAARPLPTTGWPTYPADMRIAKREGEVLARFVVGTDGTVDPSTLQVVRSSDPAFTTAVRDAIPALRFQPARVGGRAVRQLIEQPFTFALSKESRN